MENLYQTILLVDDESRVLSSFSRELSEMDICHVLTAPNAAVGLQMINENPQISAVFSDYYMPGMDGVSFLSEVRKINPDITRVIITGAAAIDMAIDAVNIGQIFRFLIKPCPPEVFIQTVQDAIRQNQLITGERTLLNKTLNGAVKTLIDILALFSPEVFAQAGRLRDMAHQMTTFNGFEQSWEMELAALLCQIGCVTVPRETLEKSMHGEPLSNAEEDMIKRIPESGRSLLINIPRMERIAEAIYYQNAPYQGLDKQAKSVHMQQILRISSVLHILLTYDHWYMRLNDPLKAFYALQKNKALFDPKLLQIFQVNILGVDNLSQVGEIKPQREERVIEVTDLMVDNILARNIMDTGNRLVVARGTIITEVLKMRLVNYALSKRIERKIWIYSTPAKK
jgi:response regulator RpfG family c-di-GMP phosphodiesterase